MSNFIVLVKQVPDVTRITDDAFDHESGTLLRARLESVINELDTHALAFTRHLKKISSDPKSKIVALSMGPPMAAEVLSYCLCRCADSAVLLTDKALGGADTYATANSLAFAIKKIAADLFAGSRDFYIVAGMQSVDGDTAQVPPQIAQELSLPCIAYITSAEYRNNRFEFNRIVSGGTQTVAARKTPAVLTVAKYEYPLFATFAGSRRANRTSVTQWSAADINAPHIGVKGSKTSVIRVFPPPKTARKCINAGTVKSLAAFLIDSLKSPDSLDARQVSDSQNYILPAKRTDWFDRSFEGTENENEDFKILARLFQNLNIASLDAVDEFIKSKILAAAGGHFHKNALDDMLNGLSITQPSFKGEVWVVAELQQGNIHPATFELIAKARTLADSLDTNVGLCLAGHNLASFANVSLAAGADNIYLLDHKLLADFDPAAYRKAIADCINTYQPHIVLYAATPQGRILAPLVSYSLGCGLTADCTALDIKDSSRKAKIALLFQTRPALGGNVMATICTKDSASQMATARPGVFKKLPPDYSRRGVFINHPVKLSKSDRSVEILKTDLATGSVNFSADIIVSGGKGLQNRDNYNRLIGSLCSSLAAKLSATVEKGASRAAVEQKFIDRIHQVGQTGTAVAPILYIAVGISGAIQHMIGVANARSIIAINSDPNAPIFKHCDYYLVANAEQIIPQLISELENAK